MKKICLFFIVSLLSNSPQAENDIVVISNVKIIPFVYTKQEIYNVFTRQQTYLKGSNYPVKLILFNINSDNQRKLCEYLNIEQPIFEQQLQRKTSAKTSYERVTTESEMIETVGKYSGAIGYLPDKQLFILNVGQIIELEVEK